MPQKLERCLLRELIARDPSNESRQLQRRLVQTECDRNCIRRVLFFLLLLCMLSLAGGCYGAILAPEVFLNRKYHLLQGVGGLFAGGLSSLVVFFGYYVWKRSVIRRLYREGRHRFLTLAVFRSRMAGGPRETAVLARLVAIADEPNESAPPMGNAPAVEARVMTFWTGERPRAASRELP